MKEKACGVAWRSIACDKCGSVYEQQHPTPLPQPTPPQEEKSNVAEQTQVKASSVASEKCGIVHEHMSNVKKKQNTTRPTRGRGATTTIVFIIIPHNHEISADFPSRRNRFVAMKRTARGEVQGEQALAEELQSCPLYLVSKWWPYGYGILYPFPLRNPYINLGA